jgi:hypothetical protein
MRPGSPARTGSCDEPRRGRLDGRVRQASPAGGHRKGEGASLGAPLRRLEALTEPEPSLKGKLADIGFEHALWVRSISEDLLPKSIALAVDEFRVSRGFRSQIEDPWIEVDYDFVVAQDTRVARRWAEAELKALEGCRRYEQSRKTSFLREAVAELEAAKRYEQTRRPASPTVAACQVEGNRLGQALKVAVPRDPLAFFVQEVRARIEEGSAAATYGDHWLSRRQWAVPFFYKLEDVGVCFQPGSKRSMTPPWRSIGVRMKRRRVDNGGQIGR